MKAGSKLNGFLVFSVFSLFALCVLAVVLTGAQGYARRTQQAEAQFARRTAAHYLSTRVRQAEFVTVTDFEGLPALTIGETVGEQQYLTRIYSQNGVLKELYSEKNTVLTPDSGEILLELEGELSFSLDEDLLVIQLPGQELTFSLRGKEELP